MCSSCFDMIACVIYGTGEHFIYCILFSPFFNCEKLNGANVLNCFMIKFSLQWCFQGKFANEVCNFRMHCQQFILLKKYVTILYFSADIRTDTAGKPS